MTDGTRNKINKSIFEAKIGPKMDPGGVRKRVRKTIGNRGGHKCLSEVSGAAKKRRKAPRRVKSQF